jgi:hypothetical protein
MGWAVDAAFIPGTDVLMDIGVTATFCFGELAPAAPNR